MKPHPEYKHGEVVHIDYEAGIKTTYIDIDDEKGALVKEMMNQQELLDANKERRAETAGNRWGDMALVASVPMHLAEEVIFPALKNHDDAFVKKWLNNSDNLGFRTKEGKV